MRRRVAVAFVMGTAFVLIVGAAYLGGRTSAAVDGGEGEPRGDATWSAAEAAAVIALLDHEQGLVALGHQAEAQATDPALRADGARRADEANRHVIALDAELSAQGYDYPDRIELRGPQTNDAAPGHGIVAVTCGVSRGDALGVLAGTPAPDFDGAYTALVEAQVGVEQLLLEAAAGIEPASSALQALA